ncbi:MAG TPA: Fic family protein [Candidatus Paceibacterota bacterium]|nr:Fic family protein [Candidatus Paceibacterota bacterium]
MKNPPNNWYKIVTPELTTLLWQKTDTALVLRKILEKAQEKYVPWDVFRHYPFPKGVTSEQAWGLLKMQYRLPIEATPIRVKDAPHTRFGYNPPKSLFRLLTYIDTHTSGLINTFSTSTTSAQRDQLVMSSLVEEAIASSQIEGASTSRKVAKEMLYSGRKARNMGEQMIINNYQVMQYLTQLKDLELSEEMLLDIQKRITYKTLEDPNEGGRFRTDADNIVVMDKLTGEIAFEPPKEAQMLEELKELIKYANTESIDGNSFVHPFLKATILHFWVAYLHPFTDGNGRTARAVFYWYLLKKNYWLFEYLSVSRIIKTSKRRYDEAFIHTETDDNDLNYFIMYMAGVTAKAIDDLKKYYERKLKEDQQIKDAAKRIAELNERQIALISYFKSNPNRVTNIKHHQTVHGIVYETARKDLFELRDKGLLVESHKGKKKIYIPNVRAIKSFLKD